MKKISQTLWGKEPFQILVNFSCLSDEVHTFHSILLKLAWIVYNTIDINPTENEENPSNSFGKRYI